MKRFYRLLKKILKGQTITQLKYPAAKWDDQFKKGKWKRSEELGQNLGIVSRMVMEASLERPIRVLDVGCGSGVQGQYLSLAEGVSYHGLDISTEAIALAKARVPTGTFWIGDMETSVPTDMKFDVIIFAEVLYYTDYARTLSVFKPHLAPNGFVVISLYDSWRTWIIRRGLAKLVSVAQDVSVRDHVRGIGWRVYKCTLT